MSRSTALKIAKKASITILESSRSKCQTPGCQNLSHLSGRRTDGSPIWRKWCSKCHGLRTGAKYGLTNMTQVVAKNAGMTVGEYHNQFHPYRKHRKDYCENIDARLGFTCTTTILWEGMLDVDHKNGKPNDNRKANLQTLCKCCHAYKSNKEKDYLTPGRKVLGISG